MICSLMEEWFVKGGLGVRVEWEWVGCVEVGRLWNGFLPSQE